jgi:hypothetical protein
MSRFLALVYAPTVIKPGYKPPKKAIVPRRPRAFAPDARPGQCMDLTPLPPMATGGIPAVQSGD